MVDSQQPKTKVIPNVVFGYKGKTVKWATILTEDGQAAFKHLRRDLRQTGGTLRGRVWLSFGKLNQLKGKPYHCHLNHEEVVIWQLTKKGADIQCIFSYIGPRKDAPY
ncbi:MAG: hypothetical protein LBS31_09180 [Candidatus Adiutrix sp.]|jgi:hypothetical protein|nr:hypothetical protein [Candidatus Adiutrix sp.]